MSGDFLSITLPGNTTPTTYPRSSIEVDLASDLVARGFSVESASDVAQALTVAMDGIASIETGLTQYVADIPYISDLSAKFETPSEIGSITYLSADAGDVQGTADFDYVNGGGGNDQISGGAGSDWLEGNGGSDQIIGGADSDVLIGGSGIDQLFGGGADDFIFFDAEDTVVNGGTGRDVAVALGQDGVTVNMAAQGLECIIGCDGADTITVGGGSEPLFAAGGKGSDAFTVTFDQAEGPKVLWGGVGADTFDFYIDDLSDPWADHQLGIAVVSIVGLTEEMFASLTLADLGLGTMNLSEIDAIIVNPDADDTIMMYGSPVEVFGTDPNLYTITGYQDDASFGIRMSDYLGGQHAIQSVFLNEHWAENEYFGYFDHNIIRVTASGTEITEVEDFFETGYSSLQEAIQETQEDAQDWFDAVGETFLAHPESDSPYWNFPFFVVGGSIDGSVLTADGSLEVPSPSDPGATPFDWLLAA
jgi:RTX calcium-binding nonapeptide repeat (4 copies)